jgi:hypothetical protein
MSVLTHNAALTRPIAYSPQYKSSIKASPRNEVPAIDRTEAHTTTILRYTTVCQLSPYQPDDATGRECNSALPTSLSHEIFVSRQSDALLQVSDCATCAGDARCFSFIITNVVRRRMYSSPAVAVLKMERGC